MSDRVTVRRATAADRAAKAVGERALVGAGTVLAQRVKGTLSCAWAM